MTVVQECTATAIVKVEGDTYTVYVGAGEQPRPAALPREAAKGQVLQVLKRKKP